MKTFVYFALVMMVSLFQTNVILFVVHVLPQNNQLQKHYIFFCVAMTTSFFQAIILYHHNLFFVVHQFECILFSPSSYLLH